ncbi:NUDIX hydrolase [Patescibacteria group bacterium]|nr:NUDIX hydrolase [Patescibacteria group bacterium]
MSEEHLGEIPVNQFLDNLQAEAKKDGIVNLVCASLISNEKGEILLVQRPQDDFMPDLVELPSGNVDGAESLYEGLIRESEEEVGFKITGIESYIGFFDYMGQSGEKKRQFNFHVKGDFTDKDVNLSAEHARYFWVNPGTIESLNISSETEGVLERFWRNRLNASRS